MEELVIPTTNRRKLESKTLITNAIKYMEDMDFKMSEISQNIINFYREYAKRLDDNKNRLKQTEINFQVALAQCGDQHDDMASNQEDDLQAKVKEMTQAKHHVELNEKLQECFDILDAIQKTYRNYNTEYVKIVNGHPNTMNEFYDDFEASVCGAFKIYKEELREQVEERLKKETEMKQEKLYKKAMKKHEAEQRAEEAKRAAEEAKAGKA